MQPSYLRIPGAAPSPCVKTAQLPPEKIPCCAARSDTLKLTCILHFRRVLAHSSPSITWLGALSEWPTHRRWSSLASTLRDASPDATLIALSSAQRSSRRRTRRGEVVASFLL